MKKPFYITTPIYYPSGNPHIGHSYSTVAADTIARFKRMQGFDVMFLTGTDEHGQKIEEKAKEASISPKQYVDNIAQTFIDLWKLLNISNDRFIRTTDQYHKTSVQNIFKQLYDQGDIYKGSYKGLYCTPCESFWTKSQLVDGKCPDCGRDVEETSEEAYFFKLSKYGDKLLQYYKENPDFIQPKSRENEMINNFIKPGLEDLCVSRTSFKWGVPVTFDQNHVVYVWIDALSNYITALGYQNEQYDDFDKYWPCNIHLVGKEIVRFHTIVWPAILMALDLPLPKQVFGHGWVLLDGGKMSKSKGNVVDPNILCDRYSVDGVRYFLLREIPFGSDGVFSNEALITRINSDLANDLGNLVSRTVAMVHKYFDGTLLPQQEHQDIDNVLTDITATLTDKCEKSLDAFLFGNALSDIFKLISRANKYIDETTPWLLAKDPAQNIRLSTVLYNLCEVIRIAAVLLSPFMPKTCEDILSVLSAKDELASWNSTKEFGLLPKDLSVPKMQNNLFPRIDLKTELEFLESIKPKIQTNDKASKPTAQDNGIIGIEDFAKINLICAQIKSCDFIDKSDKLLKLVVDDGSQDRQIVSGIREFYQPDQLIGKKVAVVANLKPVKLRGVASNGMILAATSNEKVNVIFLDETIANGSKIR